MNLRLFIAIELDHAGRRAVGKLIDRLRGDLGGKVRWVGPEQMHLTLAFLGQVAAERAEAIGRAMAAAAATVAPFEFALRGVGAFPDEGRPRVIWAGIEEPAGCLARLHAALSTRLAELGFRPEDRPFRPHVTLGRVSQLDRRTDYLAALMARDTFAAPEQSAEELLLISSELGDAGPRYTPVASARLGRA